MVLRSGYRVPANVVCMPRGPARIDAAWRAVLACALAAGACATPPKRWMVELRAPHQVSFVLGGKAHAFAREVEIEPERAEPLTVFYRSHVFTGLLAVGYEPRADLVAEFDERLLEAAATKKLTLLGWANDDLGECDLLFVADAAGRATGDLAARDLAERYTGPLSGASAAGVFGWSVIAGMAGGRGGSGPIAEIGARHVAGAAWIDGEGVLHGVMAGDVLAFLRARDSRVWIGPLWWRAAPAADDARELRVALGDAFPACPPLPTFSVGNGRHGAVALGVTRTEGGQGTCTLRLDARSCAEAEQIVIVAAERGAVSELSSTAARVVAAAGGLDVIVWSPRTGETLPETSELTWRAVARGGQP